MDFQKVNEEIYNNLTRLLNELSVKSDEFLKEIDVEIDDLNKIYNDMKDYIDFISKNKLGLKATTDMYANLINLKKLLIETRDKKSKMKDTDLRTLKGISECLNKLNNEKEATNSELDAISLITNLIKK